MLKQAMLIGLMVSVPAQAGVFATADNAPKFGGKTVLTTDLCLLKIDTNQFGVSKANLDGLQRAFYYTKDGETNEGCWKHEYGSVLLVWPSENIMRRRPIGNFDLSQRGWE